MDFVNLREHRGDACIGNDIVAPGFRVVLIPSAASQASHHIGMRLVDDMRVRAMRAHRLQQTDIGVNTGLANRMAASCSTCPGTRITGLAVAGFDQGVVAALYLVRFAATIRSRRCCARATSAGSKLVS